jgi:2-keto-4-pentenoate hydratase/2-oxohepta-3-ene-1,7-dioic acid hydratase in catechol pathway
MVKRYVRFDTRTGPAYGLMREDKIYRVTGDLFGKHSVSKTGTFASKAQLLAPIVPRKIFAVGLNYKSHLGGRPAPAAPEIFYKPVTSILDPLRPIVIPPTSQNLHYEGELVLIIGRRTKRADPVRARQAIWGVTCGNDVSERDWQHGPSKDLQWWRAKGCDTFGPLGPIAVRGLDYNRLQLTTRLNGEVVQQQTTADLLFPPEQIVSYISQFVTLDPGDLIFTGTPGTTRKMEPGDVVEVEIEGIGVLRNPVT